MKRNRLILAISIIATAVFASFFGGNLSYALFYITLTIPTISFLYTFFVYCRFKIFQRIEQRKVQKGEFIPYEFTLSNEDIISFTNIKVNFHTDKSYVLGTEGQTEYLLLPGHSNTLTTELCCKYRGEYEVGVKSVVITDYLFLFSITYPIHSKLILTVLPRVFVIEKLNISQSEQDPKKTKLKLNTNNEQLDIDVRKYSSGDSQKLIHWKVSARKNMLFSRQHMDNAKEKVMLIMDLVGFNENELNKIIIEDKIIESTLMIANYYKNNSTNIVVCYDNGGLKENSINNIMDFEVFYDNCAHINFNAKMNADEILHRHIQLYSDSFFGIIITHILTNKLYETARKTVSRGIEMTVILISEEISESVKQLVQDFLMLGIKVVVINNEDKITDVLSA